MHLIGYGNPGRCDDGLGPAFAERMITRNPPGLLVSTSYQLTVDHALLISKAKLVIFADALMYEELPFRFSTVRPDGAQPEAYILGISGQEFGEVREGLSATAKTNLDLAEAFFLEWLKGLETTRDTSGRAHA